MNFLNLTSEMPHLGGMGSKQTTSNILMIEPVAFGFNPETSVNNYFQQTVGGMEQDIQPKAIAEFNGMVDILRSKGLNVMVVKDTPEPHTPDSIFPNNWISFHEGGQAVLYPMFARNRRNERREDVLQYVSAHGSEINNVDDFTFWEDQNLFLEGTGSMILDRTNKIAYAALSERTDKGLFLQLCKVFEMKPVYFSAYQSVLGKRLPVYHTNVMLSVAGRYAVICLDAIDDTDERKAVTASLEGAGKEIVTISEQQMNCFAGNMLQVENRDGKLFLVLSRTAFDSLHQDQIERLSSYNELIVIPIPTIERVGGGSVRCMMAEVF